MSAGFSAHAAACKGPPRNCRTTLCDLLHYKSSDRLRCLTRSGVKCIAKQPTAIICTRIASDTRADPADRFGGGGNFWPRGPNLPPFSTFSMDLGHFILTLLNFDTYFLCYVYFLYLFICFWGGGKTYSQSVWGHGPVGPPLDPPLQRYNAFTHGPRVPLTPPPPPPIRVARTDKQKQSPAPTHQ